MNPNTVTGAALEPVKRGTATPVAASVIYVARSSEVVLNPNSNPIAGTIYTATIRGGENG